MEEYLDGPEFSVEMLDGEAVIVVGKHLGPHPDFLELGHDVPAAVGVDLRRDLVATARAATLALGLTWGAAHVELRLTRSGPRIVEVNPRLAGGMIPIAVTAATGRDLVAEVVARSCGADRSLAAPPAGPAAAAIRFLVPPRAGRLAALHGLAEAAAVPGVRDVHATRQVGDPVSLSGNFQDRIGHLLAVGAGLDEAVASAEKALGLVRVSVT